MKLPKMGNAANERWFHALFFWEPCGAWMTAIRCFTCGHGIPTAPNDSGHRVRTEGAEQCLCDFCGVAVGTAFNDIVENAAHWVGRRGRFTRRWEWLPFEKIPADFRALIVQAPDPAPAAQHTPDPNDLDARVRAQVEVELVAALAKHEATCNCRKAL